LRAIIELLDLICFIEIMENNTNSSLVLPLAIVFGFGMIAVSIYLTNQPPAIPAEVTNNDAETTLTDSDTVRPPTEDDYIKGNPNAPIVMIEYSDYECPFCKQFHETMNRVMNQYGISGDVAWVYRQFPLNQLHPNASRISEAALCVGELGGNNAFWDFTDRIFMERDIDAPTNVTRLPEFANLAGVSESDYIRCVNSGRHSEAVSASVEEALNVGARGTPYTVIMVGDEQEVINGAQPYSVVSGVIENILNQLEGIPVNEESS
jgi:protein-disulfide isomerase